MSDVSDSSAVSGPRQDKSPRKSGNSSGRSGSQRTTLPAFYRQIVAELRKVVYPTREQLATYFVVVMVFVIVLMAIVAGLDLGLGKLAFLIFGHQSGN